MFRSAHVWRYIKYHWNLNFFVKSNPAVFSRLLTQRQSEHGLRPPNAMHNSVSLLWDGFTFWWDLRTVQKSLKSVKTLAKSLTNHLLHSSQRSRKSEAFCRVQSTNDLLWFDDFFYFGQVPSTNDLQWFHDFF